MVVVKTPPPGVACKTCSGVSVDQGSGDYIYAMGALAQGGKNPNHL